MVGDTNQAIFGFSGADIKYMTTEFVRDFGAIEKKINDNYRSSKQVLQLAQHIKPNGGLPQNYFEGKVEIKAFDNEIAEAKWIVEDIKNWLIHKKEYTEPDKISVPIQANDIAILARNRYIWKKVEEALEKDDYLKDKFSIKRVGERFTPESKIIRIFDLGLSILINPQDILHFKALCYELQLDADYKPLNTINFLLKGIKNVVNTAAMPFIATLVDAWEKINHNQKILNEVCNTLLQDLKHIIITDDTNELLMIENDIAELQKLWTMFIKEKVYESQNISNFKYFLAMNKISEQKEGVTLATVHTLKGLEYEIIYIIGMNEGVFPDYRAKNIKNLAEEKNSAYVAITRAKRAAFISHTKVRNGRFAEISSFIKDFDVNLLKKKE
jgi:DNA helicase-2/ATP-dependent DNA helicase PcrA